jgi:hypothetical protein
MAEIPTTFPRTDYAGQTVTVDIGYGLSTYRIDGYWDVLTGVSWRNSAGNPASINYAIRAITKGLPNNDLVLYGKIGPLGYLVHVTEIVSLLDITDET